MSAFKAGPYAGDCGDCGQDMAGELVVMVNDVLVHVECEGAALADLMNMKEQR